MSTPTEPLRPRLERLRKTLRHWQICSAEYEKLLSSLEANREDMLAVGAKFTGKIVDEKEVKNLLGDGLGTKRTAIQVIAEITHRIGYAQENVMKIEQQIEQGENEIDENEEDEEDEYEAEVNTKYKPTAEGLASPQLQKELEEFRKRIKERGEAARAEKAKCIAEEQAKPKKKRKGGGVRFADPDEESKPGPTFAPTKKKTTADAEHLFATGTKDKLHAVESPPQKLDGDDIPVGGDEDGKLQPSIAEEVEYSPKKVTLMTVTPCGNSPAVQDAPVPSFSG